MIEKAGVYIVIGYSMLRSMFCSFLSDKGGMIVLGESADGAAAYEDIIRKKPQLVLLDIVLPNLSGIELTGRILAALPNTLILAITEKPEAAWLIDFLRQGGKGYLRDCCSEADILRAIQRVMVGKTHLEDDGVQLLIDYACQDKRAKNTDTENDVPPQMLSDRERQILYLYVHGYNSADMASMLLISTSTVSTYIRRVREKLRLEHKSELVEYVSRYELYEDWQ